MVMRFLLYYLIIVVFAVGMSSFFFKANAAAGPCGLHLRAPQFGEPRFAIPPGGRSVIEHRLRGRFLHCAVLRRNGTLRAELDSDQKGRILSMLFYYPTGKLQATISARYARTEHAKADYRCTSTSQASYGPYWIYARHWWLGTPPKGIAKDAVISALRNASNEWTSNLNWCGIPDEAKPGISYQGTTPKKIAEDGVSVIDWGTMTDQGCDKALACTVSFYNDVGAPDESDIRFNTIYKWAVDGNPDAFDIRSVAAHEIGHSLQFGHVEKMSDDAALMYPYYAAGDLNGRKLSKGEALENNKHY